jgi:hypothetical protein
LNNLDSKTTKRNKRIKGVDRQIIEYLSIKTRNEKSRIPPLLELEDRIQSKENSTSFTLIHCSGNFESFPSRITNNLK